MDKYFEIIKDFIVVLTPIIAAYLSYKNGKKTRKDIKIEIEKIFKKINYVYIFNFVLHRDGIGGKYETTY